MLFALVLLSAFLHASWNALLRQEKHKDQGLIAAVSVATLIALAVAGARWAATGDPPFPTTESLAFSLAAGATELLYFLALAKALDRGGLGPVYTISRGGAVLVVYPVSIWLYGERLTTISTVGSVVVLAGIVLAGWQPGVSKKSDMAGVAWATVCAAAIAGYHLLYKASIRADGNPSAIFAVALTLATLINIIRADRPATLAVARTRTLRVLAMGTLCGASFLILMEALSRGDSGFVLTLRNTSVLFATGLAWLIGEPPRPTQAIGSVCVAAGAILMAY